tara:strand:- start:3983 stop:4810 length:828 start_codon:yes stop_codon:yes gene_type:complete
MALISIVVPFFNSSETIGISLRSIKKQQFKDFECLLIDDGSFDNSTSIVKKFIDKDKRFKLFKNPKKGVVSARNYGIKKSKGRYLTFLDADDIWHPLFLKESILFRKNSIKDIPITHSSYYRFNLSGEKLKSELVKPPKNVNHKNILKKNFLPLLTTLIDRKIIREIYFDDARPEDYKLWINLIYVMKNYSISLEKPLAYYRVSDNQRSNNKFMSLRRIFKLYGQIPDANFINQITNTINWFLYNSIQRINKAEEIDKNNIDYLKKTLNYSKISE